MRWLENLITAISPEAGARRAHYRRVLAAYEAAKPTTLRKLSRDASSGNLWVSGAGNNLRNQARYLDANHDLARGVLNALVNNTVGASGIGIEPQPRTIGGEIHEEFADQLSRLFKEWSKNPECTGIEDWPGAQRLLARSWFRDGESFAKDLIGNVPFLEHNSIVPYTLEMLEMDMCPLDLDDYSNRIVQGIQKNAWGRPLYYYFYKEHPGERFQFRAKASDFSIVAADRINHIATRDRIGQLRGVSIFASVMTRLDDIKDYEESERIAAKIAASMAAFIRKGTPELYDIDKSGSPRAMKFQPGMVFDDLLPGEDISTIDTNRPNPQLIEYRKGQLRAVASGTGANYSTIARDYDGSYSSQRQELVEGWLNYQVLTAELIKSMVQPVWDAFVGAALGSNLIRVPIDIDPITLDDALFIGPSMPWIDPLKEAKGNVEMERAGYISGPEIIRRRGGNPRDVTEQESRWRRDQRQKELVSSADPAYDLGQQNDVLQNQSGSE